MIMDMEGYFLPEFYCRELGAVGLSDETTLHYFYKMPMSFLDLSPSQATTVTFVKSRIHGLPFVPSHQEKAHPYDQLMKDILYMYRSQMQVGKMMVAYKGGHVEKDILDKLNEENQLNIPYIDLEELGCPKVDTLIHQGYGYNVSDCGHHFVHRLSKIQCIHCAFLEVQILKEWVESKLNDKKSSKDIV